MPETQPESSTSSAVSTPCVLALIWAVVATSAWLVNVSPFVAQASSSWGSSLLQTIHTTGSQYGTPVQAASTPKCEGKAALPRSISLENLTAMAREQDRTCPEGLVYLNDSIVPPGKRRQFSEFDDGTFQISLVDDSVPVSVSRKIPKIVHQTSKHRCLTGPLAQGPALWLGTLTDHSYVFHDDDAIHRLIFQKQWPEFPHLPAAMKCLHIATAKADLWRLVVLWEYGGIYSDLDSAPGAEFVKDDESYVIEDDDDAFFVITGNYGVLSQHFMAASPRHPIMYHAIHRSISKILTMDNTGKQLLPVAITGPKIIYEAYVTFLKDSPNSTIPLYDQKPHRVPEKNVRGTGNRTATYVGIYTGDIADDNRRKNEANAYVIQEIIDRGLKKQEYEVMEMKHFHDEQGQGESEESCLEIISKLYE